MKDIELIMVLINYQKFLFFARFWRKKWETEIFKNKKDYVIVNDFITINQIDKKFYLNSMYFLTIKNYILTAKYDLFDKLIDFNNDGFNYTRSNQDLKLTRAEEELWNHYKYSACLNGGYIKLCLMRN